MDVNTPFLPKRSPITVDEYCRLKRKLLSLRRQYAQAVYGAVDGSTATSKNRRRANTLKKQIDALELKLALSDIAFPEEPSPVRNLVHNLRQTGHRIKGHCIKGSCQLYNAAKLQIKAWNMKLGSMADLRTINISRD